MLRLEKGSASKQCHGSYDTHFLLPPFELQNDEIKTISVLNGTFFQIKPCAWLTANHAKRRNESYTQLPWKLLHS